MRSSAALLEKKSAGVVRHPPALPMKTISNPLSELSSFPLSAIYYPRAPLTKGFLPPEGKPPARYLSNPICAARQPRRGQAAARLNRRATSPNAIRVSVINDRVDPVSGTWP